MTEVAGLLAGDHRLTSVRHYEAGPPPGLELVEPGETFATTKEEEWISKKKTEVLNTKQIETRVKRQVVLEDGKVVEDSGPMVTTNTTEDSETRENHQTELRKLGADGENDDLQALEGEATKAIAESSNWVAVPNHDGVVREVKERRVVSREETEEVKEVEDIQHLGDITDKEFLTAVRSGKSDLRQVLRSSQRGRALVSTGPRLVHESSKSQKVTDTEDTRELSSVLPDGKIVTETQRTTEHEEVRDDELPEDAPDEDFQKESSQRYLKTREQEDVDYLHEGVNVGHEMRFKTETMEVERRGGHDEPDLFESLTPRNRQRSNNKRQPHRYRGVSEWNERRQDYNYSAERISPSPSPYHRSPSPYQVEHHRRSPMPDYRQMYSPSPIPDYRIHHSPTPDYVISHAKHSPQRDISVTPTPPQRKKASERQRHKPEDRSRYEENYRLTRIEDDRDRVDRVEILEEPPPDYSPPSPPPMNISEKKQMQKTRFSSDTPTPTPKAKSGNIIGQSIRKLVGKIRSASAERKARQKARRSPSPSYQQGHVIDSNIGHGMDRGRSPQPIQKYYLGEDPFSESIYGRENKYDGVKPARTSRRGIREDERRSQSTLGRFSKSTGRLVHGSVEDRSTRTLPRHHHEAPTREPPNTINVSIINTVSSPGYREGPAKPARSYKSLSRSKSFSVNGVGIDQDSSSPRQPDMCTSNPHLHRLGESQIGLKSPGLISSLSRSQRDVTEEILPPIRGTGRFQLRNGHGPVEPRRFETEYQKSFQTDRNDTKRAFMSSLKEKAPELFRTLDDSVDEVDNWRPNLHSTPTKNGRTFNGDIYEPPTRLRDTHIISTTPTHHNALRRGSASSTDFSETYHTTTRNDDPVRPSVTNTTKTISKKTIPGRDGRSLETIESSETKSVTKSHYRSGSRTEPMGTTYYEERRFNSSGSNPVVIEVRNNFRK